MPDSVVVVDIGKDRIVSFVPSRCICFDANDSSIDWGSLPNLVWFDDDAFGRLADVLSFGAGTTSRLE